MNSFIAVNTPLFNGNEKKYLNECIDTGWISSEGAFVTNFEKAFSHYCHRKHGIAVANGSAALDIALKAIGVQEGDEVILPTFTIISPAYSIQRAGGIPVFVDSDPATWNMDVTAIESKITSRTKAILVVHIYGLPTDMNPVLELAKQYNLKVIEDAAEMHGQTYQDQRCGSFGDISCFSFYANKIITSGEGGMVVCNDDALAEKCQQYRNLSFVPGKRRFIHFETGWNYRMTNMQAAIGLAQFEQIDTFIEKKRAMGEFYQKELSFLANYGYQLPLEQTGYSKNIYWVFALVAPSESEKDKIVQYLNDNLIGTRPFFWSLHEQPLYANTNLAKHQFPVAEKIARQGFYIPSGLGITKDEMKTVVRKIKDAYGQA